jgi:amphi-Trp domain-containing protein
MARHVFDLSETATHDLVARQLRELADQFAAGSIELSYDEQHAPTVVVDPVDVTVDLTTHRRHVELVVRIGWRTAGPTSA